MEGTVGPAPAPSLTPLRVEPQIKQREDMAARPAGRESYWILAGATTCHMLGYSSREQSLPRESAAGY